MSLEECVKQQLLQDNEQQYVPDIENDALIEDVADRVLYKIEERRLQHKLQLQRDAEAKAAEEEQRRIDRMLDQYAQEGRARLATDDTPPRLCPSHPKDEEECVVTTMAGVICCACVLIAIGIVVLAVMYPHSFLWFIAEFVTVVATSSHY